MYAFLDRLPAVNLSVIAICCAVIGGLHLQQHHINDKQQKLNTILLAAQLEQCHINELLCKKSESDTKLFTMIQEEVLACQKTK